MEQHDIVIRPGDSVAFRNNAAFCVGTGRMGLALQEEYQRQLALAQELAGFAHIRGHGLFSDDMAIYQPYTDEAGVSHDAYCFTYLDRVMDAYRRQGLRPFLELGFMPDKLSSGTQTIFYWKGNVTPPADEGKWAALVQATLRHLADRYGEEEVSAWPCEVWNEPNLPGFWENADKEKYLRLYAVTVRAVKQALPGMRVGGPAVCGGEGSQQWVADFLAFCRKEKLPVDFVSRHAYMGEKPERRGRYLYHTMRDVEDLVAEMAQTRSIIDSYPEYRGLPMHITEFNTSYNPFCPIHDTNLNAAYVAGLLARLGDVADSYSYWTFGDVFEEQGVPARPFHGGFGMIANGLIPKPTLWTFAFFNGLRGRCVYRDHRALVMRRADGSYEGVMWNLCREGREAVDIRLRLPMAGSSALLLRMVDEEHGNPLRCWHDMGEPASLTQRQLRFLREAAQPVSTTRCLDSQGGETAFTLTLGANAVCHFALCPRREEGEYGYDHGWYETHC